MQKCYFFLCALFLISLQQKAQLTLTSPNGGENWTVGSTHQIIFSGTGSAIIQYSTNNGVSWNNITYTGTSPYSWIIPNAPSTQCKVKIQWCGSCADTSNAVFTISPSTGIDNNYNSANSLKVYPNPCNSTLHFDTDINEKIKIEIINTIEESVFANEIIPGPASIDISELPVGIYFLKYCIGGQRSYVKFLKN